VVKKFFSKEYHAAGASREKVFRKCLQLAPESSFGGVRIADRVWKTVPGGRTSNGKSLGVAVGVESLPHQLGAKIAKHLTMTILQWQQISRQL